MWLTNKSEIHKLIQHHVLSLFPRKVLCLFLTVLPRHVKQTQHKGYNDEQACILIRLRFQNISLQSCPNIIPSFITHARNPQINIFTKQLHFRPEMKTKKEQQIDCLCCWPLYFVPLPPHTHFHQRSYESI